jgi:hypothetical protein
MDNMDLAANEARDMERRIFQTHSPMTLGGAAAARVR